MDIEHRRGLKLNKYSDYEQMSRAAADFILSELRARPGLLLCTATGASPTRTYELLAEQFQRSPSTFQSLRVLKLDEWGGLAIDDPGSSETYLRKHLLGPLGIPPERYLGFDSDPRDPETECGRIRNWLAQNGPIDICVLGLGLNGHLAMNEPAANLTPFAHVAELAATTLNHSMLTESKRRPRYGLTLGLGELFHSRKILLLVSGAAKREQMAHLFNGPVTTQFPASLLWLHADVSCFCDQAAATKR